LPGPPAPPTWPSVPSPLTRCTFAFGIGGIACWKGHPSSCQVFGNSTGQTRTKFRGFHQLLLNETHEHFTVSRRITDQPLGYYKGPGRERLRRIRNSQACREPIPFRSSFHCPSPLASNRAVWLNAKAEPLAF